MKDELQRKALALRKQGKSLREIAAVLMVSQSSVSLWVRELALGQKAQQRLQRLMIRGRLRGLAANRKNRVQWMKTQTQYAIKMLRTIPLTEELAKVCCALLHWCEGNKDTTVVGFTNSDPVLVATFLHLLRKGFNLNERKFSACVHIHGYHNEVAQRLFWSKVTKIPEKQFMKAYVKKNTGKSLKAGYPGCISLRYYDAVIAKKLQILWQQFGKKYGPVV